MAAAKLTSGLKFNEEAAENVSCAEGGSLFNNMKTS